MTAQFLIYGLFDPRTDELRYVGKSASGLTRPRAHLFPSQLRRHNRRVAWLKSLLAAGLRPEIVVLEEVTNAESLPELEKLAISHYRAMGFDLVNGTEGGEGCLGRRLSVEAKRKIAEAQRGRVRTPEELLRVSAGQKNRASFSAEHRAHLGEAQQRRRAAETAEDRRGMIAGIAASNRARVWTDESRKRLSEAMKRIGHKPPVYRGKNTVEV